MFKKATPGFKPKIGPKAPGAKAAPKPPAPKPVPPPTADDGVEKTTNGIDSRQTPPPSVPTAPAAKSAASDGAAEASVGESHALPPPQPELRITIPTPAPTQQIPEAIVEAQANAEQLRRQEPQPQTTKSPSTTTEPPTAIEESTPTEPPTAIVESTPIEPSSAATASSSETLGAPISTTPSPTFEQNPATAPSKPPPKLRGRKRQSTTVEGYDAPTQPHKRQRKTPTTEDGQPRPRKRRQSRANTQENVDEENSEVAAHRKRSVTPEDSETKIVDLNSLTMADLTRDLHIGKKFSRHDELKERERQRKTTMRRKKEETPAATPAPTLPGTPSPVDNEAESSASAAIKQSPAPPKHSVPDNSGVQFQIIDGQIVIDQNSLAVDRHARAAAINGELESIVEDDFTRLITSNSFRTDSKLRGPNYWSAGETELFYRGLRMFGTDFETIAKMFPGRSRRHVKMKFNREERKAPTFVDAALTGEKAVKMDVDEYKTWTGLEFEDVGDILAEQDRRQAEYDAEEKRIADQKEEDLRKKRAALFADDEDTKAADDAAARANKRKQKKLQSYGEEVAIEAM